MRHGGCFEFARFKFSTQEQGFSRMGGRPQTNKPQQWDFIPKSSELTYSAINVNLRFHNIEDPGDRTVNECQNGHKMVTKLWKITGKYDNNCCESD